MDEFALVRRKAEQLRAQVDDAGYSPSSEMPANVHEVVDVLDQVIAAESAEGVPRQVGGVYFFKAVEVEKELGLEGFSSEFRKIHEALGRDVEREQALIENEEEFMEKYGADVVRRLDEQWRPDE